MIIALQLSIWNILSAHVFNTNSLQLYYFIRKELDNTSNVKENVSDNEVNSTQANNDVSIC